MPDFPPVDEQMQTLMRGVDFGDDVTYANMEKELRDLQREVGRLQNEYQEDLNLRQNEEMSNLQVSLLQEIQAYASQQGFDLIVGDGVLYASGTVNVTEDVLRAVESNFQAANASQ